MSARHELKGKSSQRAQILRSLGVSIQYCLARRAYRGTECKRIVMSLTFRVHGVGLRRRGGGPQDVVMIVQPAHSYGLSGLRMEGQILLAGCATQPGRL